MQLWPQVCAHGLRLTEIPVRLIYNDPTRHFGGMLDDAENRLRHYLDVLVRRAEADRRADAAPRARSRPRRRACRADVTIHASRHDVRAARLSRLESPGRGRRDADLARAGAAARADASRTSARCIGATTCCVQNVPLPEVRRRHARVDRSRRRRQPLIAAGHQTELYHPGVWVKDVLIARRRVAAWRRRAVHFAVDTDAPKHLNLRWPGGSEPLTDDPDLTTAAVERRCSTRRRRRTSQQLERRVRTQSQLRAFEPLRAEFLASLRRLALEQPKLSPALTNALHELDWSLGLRHHAMLASPLWQAEPYLAVRAPPARPRGRVRGGLQRGAGRVPPRARRSARRRGRCRTSRVSTTPSRCRSGSTTSRPATATRPSVFARRRRRTSSSSPSGDEFDFDPAADGWDAAARLAPVAPPQPAAPLAARADADDVPAPAAWPTSSSTASAAGGTTR